MVVVGVGVVGYRAGFVGVDDLVELVGDLVEGLRVGYFFECAVCVVL